MSDLCHTEQYYAYSFCAREREDESLQSKIMSVPGSASASLSASAQNKASVHPVRMYVYYIRVVRRRYRCRTRNEVFRATRPLRGG